VIDAYNRCNNHNNNLSLKKAEKKTKNDRKVIIQNTTICNLGSVRYKDELIDYQMDPYLFSQGFKYAVRKLPESFSSEDETTVTAYMNFIENWGTVGYAFLLNKILCLLQHVILSAQIGTRNMMKRIATYNKFYREISNQVAPINSLHA
jgi:hypothetical protein